MSWRTASVVAPNKEWALTLDQKSWDRIRYVGQILEWVIVSCLDSTAYLGREIRIIPTDSRFRECVITGVDCTTQARLCECVEFVWLAVVQDIGRQFSNSHLVFQITDLHEILVILTEGNREFGNRFPEVLREQRRVDG